MGSSGQLGRKVGGSDIDYPQDVAGISPVSVKIDCEQPRLRRLKSEHSYYPDLEAWIPWMGFIRLSNYFASTRKTLKSETSNLSLKFSLPTDVADNDVRWVMII